MSAAAARTGVVISRITYAVSAEIGGGADLILELLRRFRRRFGMSYHGSIAALVFGGIQGLVRLLQHQAKIGYLRGGQGHHAGADGNRKGGAVGMKHG